MATVIPGSRRLCLALLAFLLVALVNGPANTAAEIAARDSLAPNDPIGPVLAGKRVIWTAKSTGNRVAVRISVPRSRPRTIFRARGIELLSASASHVGARRLRGDTQEKFRTTAFAGPIAGPVGSLESCAGGAHFGIAVDGHRAAVARCDGSVALYDLKAGGPPEVLASVKVKATAFRRQAFVGPPGHGGRLRLAYPFLAVESPSSGESSSNLGENIDVYDIRVRRIVGSVKLQGGQPIADFDIESDGALAMSGGHDTARGCASVACPLFDIFHVPLGGAVSDPVVADPVVALATDPRIRIDGPHIVFLREIGRDLPALTAWNRQRSTLSLVAPLGTRRPILAVRDFDASGGRTAYAVNECDGSDAFITTPISAEDRPRNPLTSCPANIVSRGLRLIGGTTEIAITCRRGCKGLLELRRGDRRIAATRVRFPAGSRARGVRLTLSGRARARLRGSERALARFATRDRTGVRRLTSQRLAVTR